ncbi:hypothetical protein I553_7337 [Mycobacterium xenopi 4042]|uniref:DUF732 domain-containing protein n=1 Tax=Mycobacterium xenopi 4042 TaxID=1299334 RepID=X8E967_MYCXE|nr:hypothetical protein I553_7337 [Mycobacterium xenopi 4042]
MPASADHAGYLARLDRNHVSYVSQPDAVHWGSSVCDELRNGADVPAVVSTLKNNGGFTTRDAGRSSGQQPANYALTNIRRRCNGLTAKPAASGSADSTTRQLSIDTPKRAPGSIRPGDEARLDRHQRLMASTTDLCGGRCQWRALPASFPLSRDGGRCRCGSELLSRSAPRRHHRRGNRRPFRRSSGELLLRPVARRFRSRLPPSGIPRSRPRPDASGNPKLRRRHAHDAAASRPGQHLWHPLQRQGWFVDAVEAYRAAVESLRDDLIRVEPASPGLRAFADHVNQYVDSDTFKALVADTQAVRAELRNVRYTVHIQGLRVHVDKFEGQGDYSNAVVATFDRFATEATKDYRVPLKDFPDMNHVEEQILERVAKLYPDVFALLDEYCRRNQHFVERTIARFDREIRFYLAYLAFVHRFTAAGLAFTFPEVTTETTAVDVDDAFDLALAIKSIDEDKPIVCNDFRLSGPERIFVVTGPNQGGKTTFARTIGQCAYLAALGCPIPARRPSSCCPTTSIPTSSDRSLCRPCMESSTTSWCEFTTSFAAPPRRASSS